MILKGFSEIGGQISILLLVLTMLTYYNRFFFERRLLRQYNDISSKEKNVFSTGSEEAPKQLTRVQDIRELFSTENFIKMNQKLDQMVEVVQAQQREIEELRRDLREARDDQSELSSMKIQ